MPVQGSGSGWIREQEDGGCIRGFSEGKPGEGIILEMKVKKISNNKMKENT